MSKLRDGEISKWIDKDTNLRCVIVKNQLGISCYVECPGMDFNDLLYAPDIIEGYDPEERDIKIGYFLGGDFFKIQFVAFSLEDWENDVHFDSDGAELVMQQDIVDECARLAKFINEVSIHLNEKSKHEEFNPEDREDDN